MVSRIKYIYVSLSVVAVIILIIRYFYSIPDYPDGARIRISTKITTEPSIYGNYQRLNLKGIKTILPSKPEVHYGDFVVAEGIYREGELRSARIVSLKESEGVMYKFRRQIVDFYKKSIPEPHSSLIAGVTIGSKYQMPADFWEKLKSTGTAHVVVASGTNVILLSNFIISFLCLFISRKKAVPITIILIYNYAYLSGMDAPIIRAVIMSTVALIAQLTGRMAFTWISLGLTGFIMLMINPLWLQDFGFMLSFCATTSIVYFEPKLDKLFKVLPGFIRKDFSTTLAAQIGVTPIMLFYFGSINLLAPVINTLVLWTIVPITAIGALAGIIGAYFQSIGRLILYLIYPLTFYFNLILDLFNF